MNVSGKSKQCQTVLLLVDRAIGHERGPAVADELIECGLDDPHFGDPAGWPRWCDEDIWGLVASDPADATAEWPVPSEAFEPCEADEAWVAGLPSDEDLERMARHAAWLDHLEGLGRITDQDIVATGQATG